MDLHFDFQQALRDSEAATQHRRDQNRALQLADLTDQRNQRAITAQNEFTIKRDEATTKRQMDLLKQRDDDLQKRQDANDAAIEDRIRRKKILDLNAEGMSLPPDASNEDIASAINKMRKEKAINAIDSAQADRKQTEDLLKDLRVQYENLLMDQGTDAQKRAALKQALLDPALDVLSSKQKDRIQEAVGGKGDPQKVINDISKEIGKGAWYWPQTTKDAQKARAITQAYETPLAAMLDKNAAVQGVVLKSQIDKLTMDVLASHKALRAVVNENSQYFPADVRKRYNADDFSTPDDQTAVLGNKIYSSVKEAIFGKQAELPPPNPDPNAVLRGVVSKPIPAPSGEYYPGLVNELGPIDPSTGKTVPAIPFGIDAMKSAGTIGVGVGKDAMTALGNAGRYLFGGQKKPYITGDVVSDVDSNMQRKYFNSPAPGDSRPLSEIRAQLESLSPDIVQAMHDKAYSLAKSNGIADDEVESQINLSKRLLEEGDLSKQATVRAIKDANTLYQMVMSERSGGRMPVPQSAGITNPPPAPPMTSTSLSNGQIFYPPSTNVAQ